jgi:hypothetical protein
MDSLASSLERFNRKERNFLVRAVLGHGIKPIELSDTFRDCVATKLRIPIAADAWWATDYHIEWIAGAIFANLEGEQQAIDKARKNPPVKINGETHRMVDGTSEEEDSSRLVKGNQEDIDLVIASGLDLILIEAKGEGTWSDKQLNSKLTRLTCIRSIANEAQSPVRFHFLLMSPRPPQKLDAESNPDFGWALADAEFPRIELPFPTNALAVSRCNENGKRMAQPLHWCIYEKNR